MPISFGGQLLPRGEPDVLARVEAALPLDELRDFARRSAPVRLGTLGWPWQSRAWAPRLNTLSWPTGAGRCAVARFLVDDAQLAAIRPLAYASNQLNALPLVLSDGPRSIAAQMYVLPPRPLAKCGAAPGQYLLTLVDARYFWPDKAGPLAVTPGTTTWRSCSRRWGRPSESA